MQPDRIQSRYLHKPVNLAGADRLGVSHRDGVSDCVDVIKQLNVGKDRQAGGDITRLLRHFPTDPGWYAARR